MSRNKTLQTNVRPALSKRDSPFTALEPRWASFYAHAGLRSAIGRNEKYPLPVPGFGARGGQHHALRDAEFHFARRKIRYQHGEAPLQFLGVVRRLDAGEHGARLLAHLEGQPEQLVGALDRLGARDARHPQVELVEILDRDRRRVHGPGPLGWLFLDWCEH